MATSHLIQKYINKIAYLNRDKTLLQHINENGRKATQKYINQQRMPEPCHIEDGTPCKGPYPLTVSAESPMQDAEASPDPFY